MMALFPSIVRRIQDTVGGNKIALLPSRRCPHAATLSTTTATEKPLNPNESDPALGFLLNDLGLTSPEISKIRKTFPRFFATQNPWKRSVEAVQLFKGYGFTDVQLKAIFKKCPSTFQFRVEQVLRPRLELIKGLGLSDKELTRTLCLAPRILNVKDLEANIAFYRSVYNGNVNLVAALKVYPCFLAHSSHANVIEQINLLKQYGFCSDHIHLIIKAGPPIIIRPADTIRARMEFLRDVMGFTKPMKTSAVALVMSVRYSVARLREKFKQLSSLGLSDEQLKRVVQNCPMILARSCETIQRNMAYLKESGVPLDVLLKYPCIWGFRLENRIKPRQRVFEYLSKTCSVEKLPNLPFFINISESVFMKKYVEGDPYGPRLLEIYKSSE